MMCLDWMLRANFEQIMREMIVLPSDDLVDSWDESLYADPIVRDKAWGCGVQPWSMGNPACRTGITEREWSKRHEQTGS